MGLFRPGFVLGFGILRHSTSCTPAVVAYLWDMLQAARGVTEMMKEHDFPIFLADRILQRAVERSVEIVDEATRVPKRPESNPRYPVA